MREENQTWSASEFIFSHADKINSNIFSGDSGFVVADPALRQSLFNMPMDVATTNKHRFAMFLEVFRFLYDLISMHYTMRKAYYETFLMKAG